MNKKIRGKGYEKFNEYNLIAVYREYITTEIILNVP